ncbi:MAG: hypothetical protein K2G25_06525, partial [Oscillospiraceae bacterium]|nr:hypothetical protein [Oscillospiraceae bacterium]
MTCSHCGANLMDETVCPYCRCRVEFPKQNSQNTRNFQETFPDFQNSQNYSALSSGKFSELPVKARPLSPA